MKKDKWFVTKEEYEDRMKICKSCDNLVLGGCNICFCFMPLKAKFSSSSCPINKWSASDNLLKDDPTLNS